MGKSKNRFEANNGDKWTDKGGQSPVTFSFGWINSANLGRVTLIFGLLSGILMLVFWKLNNKYSGDFSTTFFLNYLAVPIAVLFGIAFIDLILIKSAFELLGYGKLMNISEIDFKSLSSSRMATFLARSYICLSAICLLIYWYSIPLQFTLILTLFNKLDK